MDSYVLYPFVTHNCPFNSFYCHVNHHGMKITIKNKNDKNFNFAIIFF